MGEKSVALENHAGIPLMRGELIDLFAAEKNVPAVRVAESRHHAQNGGLTATRRPEQEKEFPVFNGQIHSLDDLCVAKVFSHLVQCQFHCFCRLLYSLTASFCHFCNH